MKKILSILFIISLLINDAYATLSVGNLPMVKVATVGTNTPSEQNSPVSSDGTNVSNTGIYLPRVVALTDASTVTLNVGTTDIGELSSLSQSTNFANPTGTSHDGQKIIVEILSSSSQTLTWGTNFEGSSDIALPTATSGASTLDIMGFVYLGLKSKWGITSISHSYQ